jgi:hypothetical protein
MTKIKCNSWKDSQRNDSSICNSFLPRNSIICEKINGKSLINHWHVSTPDPEIETGRVFPTLKGVEETILQWIDDFDLHLNFIDMKQKIQFKSFLLQDLLIRKVKQCLDPQSGDYLKQLLAFNNRNSTSS